MGAPSHMTEMFSRAYIAEDRLEEIVKHLKKVVVKRYGEVTVVPSAKTHIAKLHELIEEMAP